MWMCTMLPRFTDFVTVTNAAVDGNHGMFQCMFNVAQGFEGINKTYFTAVTLDRTLLID